MVSTPKFDDELLFPVKWPYIEEKNPIFRPTQSYHSVKKHWKTLVSPCHSPAMIHADKKPEAPGQSWWNALRSSSGRCGTRHEQGLSWLKIVGPYCKSIGLSSLSIIVPIVKWWNYIYMKLYEFHANTSYSNEVSEGWYAPRDCRLIWSPPGELIIFVAGEAPSVEIFLWGHY